MTGTVRLILLIALSYWVMGKLGMMLAIPPGYATAVWPAAGVAFSALLIYGLRGWPGVWLGSFAINFAVAFDPTNATTLWISFLTGAGIAFGPVAEAVVGVLLVRRWVGAQPSLETPRDVVRFMLLAGPVACSLSAIIAQLVLLASGEITWAELPFSAWVWWTGDVMGVIVMAPMVMAFLAQPEAIWRHRRWTVVAPLMGVYAAIVTGYFAISAKESSRVQELFQARAQAVVHAVGQSLEREFLFTDALAAQVRSRGQMDSGEWQRMQDYLLPYRSGETGLAWLAVDSSRGDRNLLHAELRGAPVPTAVGDSRACAALWAEFAPPVEVAGYPSLLEAMQVARDSGRGTLSAPLRRHSAPEELATCVAYLSPVFRGSPQSLAERRDQLMGFAFTLQSVAHQVQSAQDEVQGHFDVELRDVALNAAFDVGAHGDSSAHHALHWNGFLVLGQRTWSFHFSGLVTIKEDINTWQAWLALAGGLVLTSVLGMFLMVAGGQTVRVRQLVAERTQALAEANVHLQHAVERNSALVEELQHTNKELEQFAYVASHDLREPLRTIESFVGLLSASQPETRSEEEKTFLRFITDGVTRMQRLIEDLLQYSRVGRSERQLQLVDLNQVLDDVRNGLQRGISENNAVIEADQLPTVLGDPVQLGQVFQNILSNSLKYRGARNPKIDIRVTQVGAEWEIRCSDNGIGFDPAKAEQVFEPFKRLHEGGRFEGTGIGMAIVAKIIRQMGGSIRAEAIEGEGATIIFRLPVSARGTVMGGNG